MSTRVRHRSISRGRKETSDSEDQQLQEQPQKAPTTPAMKPGRSTSTRQSLVASPGAQYDPTEIDQRIEQIKDAVTHDKEQLQELNERFAHFLRRKAEQETTGQSWKQRYDDLFDQSINDMEIARNESVKQLLAISQTNHDLVDQISTLTSQVELLQNERTTLSSAQHTLQVQLGVYRQELSTINEQLKLLKVERTELLRKTITTATNISFNTTEYENLSDEELMQALGMKDGLIEDMNIAISTQKTEISRITTHCSSLESSIRSYELDQSVLLELITGYEELLFQNGLINTFSKHNLNNPDLKDDRSLSKITKDIASRRSSRRTIVPPTPVKATPGKKKSASTMTDKTPQKSTKRGTTPSKAGKKGPKRGGKQSDQNTDDDQEVDASDADEADVTDLDNDEEDMTDTEGKKITRRSRRGKTQNTGKKSMGEESASDIEEDDQQDSTVDVDPIDAMRYDVYLELRSKFDTELHTLEKTHQKETTDLTKTHRDQVQQINTVVKQLQGQLLLQENENATLQQKIVLLETHLETCNNTIIMLEQREDTLNDKISHLEVALDTLQNKYDLKCAEYHELLTLKHELTKQLIKYERLLTREEQRLGIYGLINEIEPDFMDKDSELFDKLLSKEDIPSIDAVTMANNTRLGISPFYATNSEEIGRDDALLAHQEFITMITDQIDNELATVDQSLNIKSIQQNDFAKYVNNMAATIESNNNQQIAQAQAPVEGSNSSWFGGLFGLFGNDTKQPIDKKEIKTTTTTTTKEVKKRKRGTSPAETFEETTTTVTSTDDSIPASTKKRASYISDDLFDVDVTKIVTNDDDDEFVSTNVLDSMFASNMDETEAEPTPTTRGKRTRRTAAAEEEVALQNESDLVQLDEINPFDAISVIDTDKTSRLRTRKLNNNTKHARSVAAHDDTLNQITPNNQALLVSGVDEFGQYIKIINGGDYAINLEGWSLFTHGREFRFIFPKMAVIPSRGSFMLRTLTNDDAENTFEPDDDHCVTIFVKHVLWSEEDDRCTLFSNKGKERGSVSISRESNMFPQITQPGGCSIM